MILLRKGNAALIGLTDVNLRRLQGGSPVAFPLTSLIPPDDEPPRNLVIFHATRASIVELADALLLDTKELLDALGEG